MNQKKHRFPLVTLLIGSLHLIGCVDDIKGPPGPPDAMWSARRPLFYTIADDTTQVIVPASEASPSRVFINGSLFTNKIDVAGDIHVSGRGGLDRGNAKASTAYYLYAIPDETETSFDLVISANPPSAGPSGFPDWSYLGAFVTDSTIGGRVLPIYSQNGFATIEERYSAGGSSSSVSSTTWTSKTISPYPVTVTRHWGSLVVTGGATNGEAEIKGSKDTPTNALIAAYTGGDSGDEVYGFVPATDGATVWMQVSSSTLFAYWAVYGWEEDLLRYP